VIENRFPTLFESRRMGYPRFEELADSAQFDQGVGGFLDHIMKRNFTAFVELAESLTGQPVAEIERVADNGAVTALDARVLDRAGTLIVISFDSFRTVQEAGKGEVEAVRAFLAQPDRLAFVCPHHDIGDVPDLSHHELMRRQLADFLHHGDKTIPPQQVFGRFARSLLADLGVPVENRYGLHPAAEADGSPSLIEVETAPDRLRLLQGVRTFNLHPHLPHLERIGDAINKLDVLARQKIDLTAPPHPFSRERATFDALLQSRADAFAALYLSAMRRFGVRLPAASKVFANSGRMSSSVRTERENADGTGACLRTMRRRLKLDDLIDVEFPGASLFWFRAEPLGGVGPPLEGYGQEHGAQKVDRRAADRSGDDRFRSGFPPRIAGIGAPAIFRGLSNDEFAGQQRPDPRSRMSVAIGGIGRVVDDAVETKHPFIAVLNIEHPAAARHAQHGFDIARHFAGRRAEFPPEDAGPAAGAGYRG
jgi:hypothetical protein